MNFLDIRDHGFFRLAAVVPKVELANPKANVISHLKELSQVYDQGAMYTLCPELGLTGYSCGDLFHSQLLLDQVGQSLREIIEATKYWDMIISVGLPLKLDFAVYNTAVTFYQGQILAVTPKAYPPEYREFYELRHFARASEAQADVVNLFDQDAPFGTDIIIYHPHNNFSLHVEICEDGWVPIPPSTSAALAGATVLANMSASDITIGKHDYRLQLMLGSSGRNLAVQMYCAAGFGESTSDVSWDGDAIIAERGNLLASSERFQLDGTHIIADVDLIAVEQDRMRQNSFRENGIDNLKEFRLANIKASSADLKRSEVYHNLRRQIDPHPFVPSDPLKRNERCYETFMIQSTALIRRLTQLPQDRRKIIVAVSGGQDSTHALMVATHAIDKMQLPRTDIIAITMPCFGTTQRTKNNAINLCQALGVTFKEIPVTKIVEEIFEAIGHDKSDTSLVFENTQAWSRKFVELAQAAKFKGLVLGTGDLSELLLGWCTYMGDHGSHYAVNAGVPKTLISFLISWTAEVIFAQEPRVQAILHDILATPISPELLPPDGETITQVTEDKIGPYELHDFFGYYFIRFGYSPKRIARLALAAFIQQVDTDNQKYDLADIKKWLGVFLNRFFTNQFKRNFMPDGPKVGLTCLSPRGDWRMPSDAQVQAWLDDWAKIPNAL
ncbi:MAG: NAD(+) synthase [Candidatus Buchananbacteria bacterium]|nr:NAD(+) synthase [Candidatus Buchananbacteria bacterium]